MMFSCLFFSVHIFISVLAILLPVIFLRKVDSFTGGKDLKYYMQTILISC